jgi:Holliday junction resolvase RusA-like endonuclease
MRIAFDVLGTPAPKGSSRAMMRGGHAVNVPSGSDANRNKQKAWDTSVREAANRVLHSSWEELPFRGVPLRVTLIFRVRRPIGHYNAKTGALKPSAPKWPITKPDKDKMFRATADSLTGILIDDDSRIVETHERKQYAEPGNEGARIVIEVMQ